MASDRGDGAGTSSCELSANAERDVSEVVRCEELPAQWEKYPLSTQREMLAGRNSLINERLAQWADEGEDWLRKRFAGKGVSFHTNWNMDDRTITLRVYREQSGKKPEFLFVEECKAENFVSHLMVTKILMVM